MNKKKKIFLICLLLLIGSFVFAEEDEFEEIKPEQKQELVIDNQKNKDDALFQKLFFSHLLPYFILLLGASVVFIFRKYRYRFVFLIVSLLYFGFYQGGCPDPVGVSVKIFADSPHSSSFFLFFLILLFLPLIFSFLGGRIFCGFVCPLGALQEFLAVRRYIFVIPYRIEKILRYIRLVIFFLLIFMTILNHHYVLENADPFRAIFNREGNWISWILVFILIGLSLFIYRPFCRYFCPLSVYLSLVSRFSLWKIKKTSSCKECNLCQKNCPVRAINPKNEVENAHCIRCGECLETCRFNGLKLERK